MSKCKICGISDGGGYVISQAHYIPDGYLRKLRLWRTARRFAWAINEFTSFACYLLPNGFMYLPVKEIIDTMDYCGVDICDRIDIDEPIVSIKVYDGKCDICIADENQLSLF